MHEILLMIHSWARWIVLILGLFLVLNSFTGLSGNKPFTKALNGMSAGFVGLFHLQILLGLILYFGTSKLVESAFIDFGLAMKSKELRFWAVEHISVMLIAAVIAQIGRIKIKKSADDKSRFKTMAIYFGIALVLVLSRIPWTSDRMGF